MRGNGRRGRQKDIKGCLFGIGGTEEWYERVCEQFYQNARAAVDNNEWFCRATDQLPWEAVNPIMDIVYWTLPTVNVSVHWWLVHTQSFQQQNTSNILYAFLFPARRQGSIEEQNKLKSARKHFLWVFPSCHLRPEQYWGAHKEDRDCHHRSRPLIECICCVGLHMLLRFWLQS